jgi:hypothetical protein
VIGTLPSLLYNWLTLGQPFGPTAYVQAGLSFRTAASGDVATSESAVVGVGSVLRVLTAHPVEFAGRYVRRLVEEAGPLVTLQGLGFPLVLFVGVGLILLARRASARTWIYIGYCVMGYLVVGLLDPLIRYYLFLLPLLCLAGALGILLAAGEAGNATERARLLAWGLLAATGALTLRTSLGQVRRALSDDPRGLQPIAERLRRLARPGDVVLARKPNLAYLAGLTDIPIVGDETLGQALQEGRARGARFLLYSPAEAEFWPPLRELATPSMAPPETRAVLVDPATNIVIYELLH